jgi:hypothetical protein
MRNGLYSIHMELLDGQTGKGSGVIVFRDGTIRGGDAFLYYTGSYTFEGGRWKGELITNQHTPNPPLVAVFSGREVSIGFSGTYSHDRAEANGTALVGKMSLNFRGTLRWLADL